MQVFNGRLFPFFRPSLVQVGCNFVRAGKIGYKRLEHYRILLPAQEHRNLTARLARRVGGVGEWVKGCGVGGIWWEGESVLNRQTKVRERETEGEWDKYKHADREREIKGKIDDRQTKRKKS